MEEVINSVETKDESNSVIPKESVPQKNVSYYVSNFKYVIKFVLEDDHFKLLFDESDVQSVSSFQSLSEEAQKLYVRLFQRKFRWHRPNKTSYPEITSDVSLIFEELVAANLFECDSTVTESLETTLELLSLAEMKILCKYFNISSTGKNKQDMLQSLLRHGCQYKSVFFCKASNLAATILKKARQIMGNCYRLAVEPKRTFARILMLFSLPNTIDEEEEAAAGGQQQQLFTLLQVNKGEVKFPKCRHTRSTVIFQSKDDLVWFEEARQLEIDILSAIENKNFEIAERYFEIALNDYKKIPLEVHSRNTAMPAFLRRYTAGHVYIRSMNLGVDILQKLKKYSEAVELLQILVNQSIYCQDYRSYWWDRLSLDLKQHLKKPEMAIKEIKKALEDPFVRGGHRFNLIQRAHNLMVSADQDAFKVKLDKAITVLEAPKIVIKGRLFPHSESGRKLAFIFSEQSGYTSDDDTTVLSVEGLSLQHYKSIGFSYGIHGESSTFISLYALLFWDIIYNSNVPDAFISPFQRKPLDLNTDCFYQSREMEISSHIQTIRTAPLKVLQEIIANTWLSHYGETSLVNWEIFERGLDEVQGLIKCLGSTVTCGICEKFSKDFRHARSGFPDLVVWNPGNGEYKIVEVKSPSDRLSSKQILWIDYLRKIPANVELCLVEVVGSKRLKSK